MSKIEEIKAQRKWANNKLLEKNSEVYKAFLQMEKATYCDGAVSRKNKELIAVGISVVINCESCMQWHVEQAVVSGATEKEIIEAIEVGIEMGGGPATAYARFALEVLDRVLNHKQKKE
jgi:AhpD family alkylhydroperoxidase